MKNWVSQVSSLNAISKLKSDYCRTDDFLIEDEAENEVALPARPPTLHGDANEIETRHAQLMARIAKMRANSSSDISRSIGEEISAYADDEGKWVYWMISVRVRSPCI